ncbi:MAG: hypothetical protein ACYC5K_05670, partial [Saccharofermentanales bacterium]
ELADLITWDGATLVNAYLIISSENNADFYFDDVSLFKEGVYVEPAPTPTSIASQGSSDPVSEASVDPSSESSSIAASDISSGSVVSDPEPTIEVSSSDSVSSTETSLITSSDLMGHPALPWNYQSV